MNIALNPSPLKRFLKILARPGGKNAQTTIEAGKLVLVVGSKNYSFDENILTHCLGEGYVTQSGRNISINRQGRNLLSTLLHPDPCHSKETDVRSASQFQERNCSIRPSVNMSESPLARLYMRRQKDGSRYISPQQYNAGEKLRLEFEQAQLQPSLTVNWSTLSAGNADRSHPNNRTDLSDFALDKRQSVFRALDGLAPELAGVALDVCCFLKGFERVEKERAWPPRSAKLMLRTALTSLAFHYGFECNGSSKQIKHWGGADYRPAMGFPQENL